MNPSDCDSVRCQAARKWESSSDDGALDFSEQPEGASTADDSDGGAVRASAPTADLTLKSRVDEDEEDEEDDEEEEEEAAGAGAGQAASAAGARLACRMCIERVCTATLALPCLHALTLLVSLCGFFGRRRGQGHR